MSRPIYETSLDLTNEDAYASFLEKQFNCELKKLPTKYGVDFVCIRENKVVAWLEIKCRKTRIHSFNDYMLSLQKWQTGLDLARYSQKPFILAVSFADGRAWINCGKQHKKGINIEYKGRTVKTRDWQDVEPVVMIPMNEFTIFENKNDNR